MTNTLNKKKARVIAYYLPQYHPTSINNEWWGRGFTEWTNVGKAKPLFKGHYQPRVPADLGYYDLRLPQVRELQAEMAKNAGVESFLYWHYWFGNGKQTLEMPINEVLRLKSPNFPFCLGWANHSWSNHEWNAATQWEKKKQLIEQVYPGVDDIVNHFNYVLPFFQDERYTTVDEKPLFLIYSPSSVPNLDEFIDRWQNMAIENGLKGIYFVGLTAKYDSLLLDAGLDALNINGQWKAEQTVKGKINKLLMHRINKYIGGIKLDVYDYKEIIENIFSESEFKENIFPTVVPQWDRSPRSGRRAVIYKNSSPELFKIHLEDALKCVSDRNNEKKIIFLKSWNEWGEGNYVEPDIVYGHGYLDAIKEVIL